MADLTEGLAFRWPSNRGEVISWLSFWRQLVIAVEVNLSPPGHYLPFEGRMEAVEGRDGLYRIEGQGERQLVPAEAEIRSVVKLYAREPEVIGVTWQEAVAFEIKATGGRTIVLRKRDAPDPAP